MSSIGVTAVDIRLRALKRLKAYDRTAVRELYGAFFETHPPTDTSCRQIAVAVPGPNYYPTLFQTFPEEFNSIVSRIATPQEAASLLQSLREQKQFGESQYAYAISVIINVLKTAKTSDRVFTATEFRLKLGQGIEEALQTGVVPPGLQMPLAQAWISYVGRQLSGERCGDNRTTSSQDMALKFTLERSQRLALVYHIAKLDTSARQTAVSAEKPDPDGAAPEAEMGELFALGSRLKNGGSAETAAEFATALNRYIAKGLSAKASSFDTTGRAGVLLIILEKLNDESVVKAALSEYWRIIEHPRLREQDPAAWILVVRSTLNLLKHPNRRIGQQVLERFQTTRDPHVSAYFSADKFAGLISQYQSSPFATPWGVMGMY
jgi:hypothetical protein